MFNIQDGKLIRKSFRSSDKSDEAVHDAKNLADQWLKTEETPGAPSHGECSKNEVEAAGIEGEAAETEDRSDGESSGSGDGDDDE